MEDGSHSTQLETLIACCQVLGLSLDELFSDVEISKAQPIQEIVREPSSSEILSTIKQALKIAENPLIQRILACSEEERRELSDSMDMIEYSRSKIGKTQQSSKLAKHRK